MTSRAAFGALFWSAVASAARHRFELITAELKPKKDRKRRRRFALPAHSKYALVGLALSCVIMTMAQTTNGPTGVVRLRVRVATGDGSKAKGLARKRFFL